MVTGAFDRLACGAVDWIEPELLDDFREFVGWDETGEWSKLALAVKVFGTRGRGKRLHGHWRGVDERMLRAALLLFDLREPRPDAVIIVRDRDHKPERLTTMVSLRERTWPFKVVLASPEPETEAWLVRGFVPGTGVESARWETLCTRLGFDPTTYPERLNSTSGIERDAKSVLAELTQRDADRRRRCSEAMLDRPHTESGLTKAVEDLVGLVQHLFGHAPVR